MDFLKEILQIQHEQTLIQVADKLFKDDFDEKDMFLKKYNKKNYCLVHVCNCTMDQRVKKKDLLSTLP